MGEGGEGVRTNDAMKNMTSQYHESLTKSSIDACLLDFAELQREDPRAGTAAATHEAQEAGGKSRGQGHPPHTRALHHDGYVLSVPELSCVHIWAPV